MLEGISRKLQFEALFVDFFAPLGPGALFDEPESGFLVEAPRGEKPFEGPEVDLPVTARSAKIYRV